MNLLEGKYLELSLEELSNIQELWVCSNVTNMSDVCPVQNLSSETFIYF